jgi:hypothetical protein
VLKNILSEKLASQKIHKGGLPLLISEMWLREYGCGQVDLARLKDEQIQIFEVKSSMRITQKQFKRLQRTRGLLEQVLKKESRLVLYVARKDGLEKTFLL